MKKSKMKTNDTKVSKNKPSDSRINNITRRNKHASGPIANTLKKHLKWCTDPNHPAYPSYGAKGRRVAPELTYTNDGPTNEAIIEKVIERIGEKPTPIKNYHLHVDWEATDGVMTLDNIAWVTVSKNTQMQSSNIRLSNGLELCKEAKAIGLNPTTATARVRNGQSLDTVLNPQLRADIDFTAQRQKHEMIDALIQQGQIFVTRAGQLYIIPELGEPFARKTRIEKTGYHSIVLMIGGKATRVQFSHVVLIQYAGLPPQFHAGLQTVWNADHIDGNKNNNRPDNLCWLPVSYNAGVKKAGGAKTNTVEFVKTLADKGIALMTGKSRSLHSEGIIEQRRAEVALIKQQTDAWKGCIRLDWLSIPDLATVQAIAERNAYIPPALLVRFALAPSNEAKVVGADISVKCNSTGRRHLLSEMAWNCRAKLSFVTYSNEVAEYLTVNHSNDAVAQLLSAIPKNVMLEISSMSLRSHHRAHELSNELTAAYFEQFFIDNQLLKTLLCAAPDVITSLYRNKHNETPNPLLLNVGSNRQKISVRCSVCGGPTELATIKLITRAHRQNNGRLCAACNAKSRARNGVR